MAKNGLLVGLGVVLGAWLLWPKKASAKSGVKNMQLSKDFWLNEFRQSETFPDIASYQPTKLELINLLVLVTKILQPLRDKYGPILITSGGRPLNVVSTAPRTITTLTGKQVLVPSGSNIDTFLAAKGYGPVSTSGHHLWSTADFAFVKKLDTAQYTAVFDWIKAQPETRQVILYKNDKGEPSRFHVEVLSPGRTKAEGASYAFLKNEAEGVA
jgi:hypothetical protein